MATDLEVDPALGRIELHILHDPRQLKTQRAGEQRFNADAHLLPPLEDRPVPDDLVRRLGPVFFGNINFRGTMSFSSIERYAEVLLTAGAGRRSAAARQVG